MLAKKEAKTPLKTTNSSNQLQSELEFQTNTGISKNVDSEFNIFLKYFNKDSSFQKN